MTDSLTVELRKIGKRWETEFEEAAEALEYALRDNRRLREALQMAYRALTEGMEDVPHDARSQECAQLRVEAKRRARQVLEECGLWVTPGEGEEHG